MPVQEGCTIKVSSPAGGGASGSWGEQNGAFGLPARQPLSQRLSDAEYRTSRRVARLWLVGVRW